MDDQTEAKATDTQAPAPPEKRQEGVERQSHHGPEALPDDYAEWLDGWMFTGTEEQQEGKA